MTSETTAARLLGPGERGVSLRVDVDRNAAPGAGARVRAGLVADGALTSVHESVEEVELRIGPSWSMELARENPFIAEVRRGRLGADGALRVGTVIEADDVLLSIVVDDHGADALGPAKGKGKRREVPRPDRDDDDAPSGPKLLRDESLIAPASWIGWQVAAVEREPVGSKDGLLERIRVVVTQERPLAPGDLILSARGVPAAVVGEVVADEAMPVDPGGAPVDLVVGPRAWDRLAGDRPAPGVVEVGKADDAFGQAVRARATGPYSIISQRPLAGHGDCVGEPMTAAHAAWLGARGLSATLAEMTGRKSDDLTGRMVERVRALGFDFSEAGPSETLHSLGSYLRAVGLAVAFDRDAGGRPTIAVRPATAEEIRGWSRGEVRLPETVDYRTHLYLEGGLFCPVVFGEEPGEARGDDEIARHYPDAAVVRPIQRESRRKDRDERRSDADRREAIHPLVRRRRFGHLELSRPVVPALWRVGKTSPLARLTGISEDDLDDVQGCTHRLIRRDDGSFTTVAEHDEVEGEDLGVGASALEAVVDAIPADRLPPGLAGRPHALVVDALPICPPDLRPIVLLYSGNFATSDINDLLRRLINRNNRLRKLCDLNAPEVIIRNEMRELDRMAEDLVLGKSPGHGDHGLVGLEQLLTGELLRLDPRPVEHAGRARAVRDETVVADQVRLPRAIVETLGIAGDDPVLLARPDAEADGRFVALRVEVHEERVARLGDRAFEALALDRDEEPIVIVHRPLGDDARAEATRLLVDVDLPAAAPRDDAARSWVEAPDAETMRARLLEAALDGEPVFLDGPRGLLAGGGGPLPELGSS